MKLAWILAILVAIGAWYVLAGDFPPPDYKNTTYTIEGRPVALVNGHAEVEAAPGSASKTVTDYFGNIAKGNLNSDTIPDLAFLLTQTTGGSGTFYYVVAALQTVAGNYQGTNAVLLGDRVAPQTTEIQGGEIVVNYAKRAAGEPMTTPPSVGVSKHLKVENGMLIEADRPIQVGSGISGKAMLGPTCPVMRNPPDPQCADKPYKTSLVVTTEGGTRIIKQFNTGDAGEFSVDLAPGDYVISSPAGSGPYPRCGSNGVVHVSPNAFTDVTVSCDTGIR